MRILFFSHYFPPELNAPATRTYEHCVRWAAAGHDVTVVTCVPNCPTGVLFPGYDNRLFRQVEWMDGVRVVRVWTYLAPNAGTVRRIANYLSYMVSAVSSAVRLARPDVVLATSPQFFCGWAGVLYSQLKAVPLVLEIRDIWPESIQAVGAMRGGRLMRLLQNLERRMYQAADHIVAVGDGYRAKILEKVDITDRISVITNGVDLKRFIPQEPDLAWLDRWKLNGHFVCSYVGTIGMAHGLDVVLKAASILKAKGRNDIRFLLVGDGASRQNLQKGAARRGVSDRVIFTGRQRKGLVPAILASSHACLIHLRGCELFGTVLPSKIFETMAMGRPIIMGVRGEARRLVCDARAGIEMEPESAESLVAVLESLADDPKPRVQFGKSARRYVEQHFNRDVLAEDYLRLLCRVANAE